VDAGVDSASSATGETERARAAVILGNDAVLAARPHTTAQLTHACGAAGFDIVVPPSWGDEIIARASLEQLANRTEQIIFLCTCERVRGTLPATLPDHAGRVALASPPVAAARYLRSVHGGSLLVTYVGDCPGAADPSIDARFSPVGFLASLHRQGIALAEQPNEATQTEAERWRRYESAPGGLPALRYLARAPIDRVMREADSVEAALSIAAGRARIVITLAEATGCSCAQDGSRIVELEPARASVPIITAARSLDLSPTPSAARGRHSLRARLDTEPVAKPEKPAAVAVVDTAAHTASLPNPAAPPVLGHPSRPPVAAAPLRASAPRARVATATNTRRTALMVVLPLVVVAAVTALGIAAYRAASGDSLAEARIDSTGTASGARAADADSSSPTMTATGELDSTRADSARRSAPDAASGAPPAISPGRTPLDRSRDSAAVADSIARSRRARRRRAPEVVPGWLPQGQRTFTPVDTSAAKRDSTRP
jgi:hypothetical protein